MARADSQDAPGCWRPRVVRGGRGGRGPAGRGKSDVRLLVAVELGRRGTAAMETGAGGAASETLKHLGVGSGDQALYGPDMTAERS